MIDTTAWARQGDPANKGWGRGIIEAQRLGQQGAIEREVNERQRRVFDLEMAENEKKIADQIGVKNLGNQMLESWKVGDTKGFDEANRRMALIDPGKAKEAYSMYGTMDRTNFNNSAWAFAGAASLPMQDIESQNAMLRKAKDLLGNDNHFFAQQLDELMAMPEGEKRTEGLIAGMNLLESMNAFGSAGAKGKDKTPEELAEIKAKTGKLEAETSKIIKETELMGQKGELDPEKKFEQERKLAKEYQANTKNFTEVQDAYRRIKAAKDNAAGDLSLIFSYMKMLDPGSVVREGEFATAQNAAGVPERVMNIYNRLIEGERLGEKQRAQFKDQANSLFSAASKREQEVRSGLENVIENYGLNSENIFVGRESESKAEGSKPKQDYTQMSSADIMQNLVKSMGQ